MTFPQRNSRLLFPLFFVALLSVVLLAPRPVLAFQTCCCAGTVDPATNSATYDASCDWNDVPNGQNCSTMGFGPPPAGTNWINAPDSVCAYRAGPKPPETTAASPGGGDDSTDPDSVDNPIGGGGLLGDVVIRVMNGLLAVLGLSATVMVMYGGYMYIFSGGNSERIEQGKTIIIWALIGLVIIVLSASIVNFVMRAIPGTAGP